jgi:hypothetical protein
MAVRTFILTGSLPRESMPYCDPHKKGRGNAAAF